MPAATPWTPKVSYGSGPTVLTLSRGVVPWEPPESEGIGASGESASGIIEAFQIRRQHLVTVTLRFLESEWSAIETWLHWAQVSGTSFGFYFDQDVPGSLHTVYLHAPALGKGTLKPERQDFPGLFTFTVTLRTADGSKFTVNWSGV